jgi:hypothetical protein
MIQERDEKDKLARSQRSMQATARAAEETRAKMARTPPPVQGRKHAEANTEVFLEVLSDRVPEEEAGVQTEEMMDRPPEPIFVPQPSGTDVSTQIEAGDLFDFDFEVSPLLDVLVGKTLEQSLLEVAQEDELAAIRAKQDEFDAVRTAELAEVQRLEAEVKRRFAEKQRRKDQEAARLKREAEVREKIAATAFARSYLGSLRRNIFSQLHDSGHFYDTVRREMEQFIMPGLLQEVASRMATRQEAARAITDDLLASALELGKKKYEDGLAAAAAAAKALAEAAEAARLAAEAAKLAADAAAAAAAAEAPPAE